VVSLRGRTRDNRLLVTRNPAGHDAAWWGKAVELGPVLDRARADSGDVPKAAARFGVKLVEHSAALQRTEQLVAKLDARMTQAQATSRPSTAPTGSIGSAAPPQGSRL